MTRVLPSRASSISCTLAVQSICPYLNWSPAVKYMLVGREVSQEVCYAIMGWRKMKVNSATEWGAQVKPSE